MKKQLLFVIGVVFYALNVASAQTTCNLLPADPKATAQVKDLLCFLKTNTYISGQTDLNDGDYVMQMTGKYPAIIAFDFYNYTNGDNVGNTSETQKAIDWAKSTGGIVAFQWHWRCPLGGGQYSGDCDFVPYLDNPNSALYRNIDLVISELKKMGDAGVPVLFRPLHEANNNYMWWAKKGQAAYIKLFRLFYNRAQLAGAHNIIWVFNGMANGQSTSMASWYPGDNYTDVVSSDYYQNYNDFNTCKAIGTNKVMAVAETFNALDPAKDPAWNYGIVWASRDWGGKGAEQSWKNAMANSKTINIDELPDFYTKKSYGTNVALNKTVTVSSTEPALGNIESNATDGDLATRWASIYSDPQSIQVDLGRTHIIDTIVLRWEAAYGSAYKVETSTDGTVWTQVSSTTTSDGGVDEIPISNVTARYVRLTGTKRATTYGYSLYEFEVYGDPFYGTNVALNKPVTVSSIEAGSNHIATNLTDGSKTTRWASTSSDNQSAIIDLQSRYLISDIVINWEAAYAEEYSIEVSNDQTNWTSVFTTTTGNGALDAIENLTETARYVRVNLIKRATNYGFSMYEVDVYGTLDVITDIKSDLDFSINVFPNPSSGVYHISNINQENWQISNVTGQEVLAGKGKIIDLTSFPKGIYYLTISHRVIKLIKA